LDSIENGNTFAGVREYSSRASGLPVGQAAQAIQSQRIAAELRARPRIDAAVARMRSAPGEMRPGRVGGESAIWQGMPQGQARLRLLVVDDDPEIRHGCGELARQAGFLVVQAGDVSAAQMILEGQRVDVMLLDLRVPDERDAGITPIGRGMALLQEVKAQFPQTMVVAMTTSGTVANAVEVMRLGAEDLLTKPFNADELMTILERAGRRTQWNAESRALRERLRTERRGGPLVGHSPEMEKLYRILSKVAHSSHPVLIQGESGTGKELLARSIHFNGPHASKPFVPVDCGAVNPALLEGELFGYARSVSVGKTLSGGPAAAKAGLLSSLEGGTVFLNEIGELSLDLQAKLLRVLQERVVHPVGASYTVPISGRVLAATQADLAAMVEQGRFRRDLYFRLNVVSLRVPPLRQRREDIPELAQYFLDRVHRETAKVHTLDDAVLQLLMAYDWPGNVMELMTSIEYACSMASGPVIYLRDLPTKLQEAKEQLLLLEPPDRQDRRGANQRAAERIQPIAELEKQAILCTIRQLRGDKLLAAKLLGIGKTTLYRKLKEYGIQEWAG
jgi:DNA-binding NtrC family response regulator